MWFSLPLAFTYSDLLLLPPKRLLFFLDTQFLFIPPNLSSNWTPARSFLIHSGTQWSLVSNVRICAAEAGTSGLFFKAFFVCLFVNITILLERQKDRDRGFPSTGLPPNAPKPLGLGQTECRSLELYLGVLCGWQGPNHSGITFHFPAGSKAKWGLTQALWFGILESQGASLIVAPQCVFPLPVLSVFKKLSIIIHLPTYCSERQKDTEINRHRDCSLLPRCLQWAGAWLGPQPGATDSVWVSCKSGVNSFLWVVICMGRNREPGSGLELGCSDTRGRHSNCLAQHLLPMGVSAFAFFSVFPKNKTKQNTLWVKPTSYHFPTNNVSVIIILKDLFKFNCS